MDFYLSEAGSVHLPEINRLAKIKTAASDDALLHYCMEGIRLNGTFGSYRQATTSCTVNDGDHDVQIKAGDKVFVSFVGAAKDPIIFPNPEEVRLDRPLDSYIHYGKGPHSCLGEQASKVALTAMLRVVGGLDGLRRAPGPQGQLKKIPRPGGFYIYMREDWGSYFPFPTSTSTHSPLKFFFIAETDYFAAMKVHFDGTLPPLRK